jgi:hypothetical protein
LIREYWIFILPSIYAIYFYKDKNRDIVALFVFSIITTLLTLGLTNIVHYRYLFIITPLLYVLGSIGFITFLQNIQNKYTKSIFILILILSIFFTKHLILYPQTHYFLESDNRNTILNKKHIAYTPQPVWNKAYNFIKENIKENEIVISSAPHFTYIFMNKSDYWINHDLWGKDNIPTQNRYTDAKSIMNMDGLKKVINDNHGYIILDYMVKDNRISKEMLFYIENSLEQVFYEFTNDYSQIWIYKF